jgi:hypothetical protein
VCAALLPVVLGCLGWAFRWHARFGAVVLGAACASAALSFAVYPAAIRHLGMTWIGFAALAWIARAEPGARGRLAPGLPVLGLLAMGAVGGGFALAGQWMRPFATNGDVVRWLRANGLADAPLTGFPDMRVEPVAVLLGRGFHALECRCATTYVRFDSRRNGFEQAMVPERLDEALRAMPPGPAVFLAGDPLTEAEEEAIRARGIALVRRVRFDGAERDIEQTVYTAERTR